MCSPPRFQQVLCFFCFVIRTIFDAFCHCSEHPTRQLLDKLGRRSRILRTDPPLPSGRVRLPPVDTEEPKTQLHPRFPRRRVSRHFVFFSIRILLSKCAFSSEKAGIAPLLDVDDMVACRKPDWKCVFTYVQSIYRRFKDEDWSLPFFLLFCFS